MRVISQEIVKISIFDKLFEIVWRLQPHLPGTNDFKAIVFNMNCPFIAMDELNFSLHLHVILQPTHVPRRFFDVW